MKGLYVINSLEGGGAERVFCRLLSLKKEDRKDTLVIILDDLEDAYQLPEDLEVIRLQANKSTLSALFSFIRTARKFKPDYTVSFLTRANLFNVIGSFFARYKAIISERSYTMGRLNKGRFVGLKVAYVKLVYALSDAVIAVSGGVKKGLETDLNVASDKIFVLNNPVDIPEANSTNSDIEEATAPIAAMGRLVETKGFDTLLQAYAQSKVSRPLIIMGQGPNIEALKTLANELNIADKVNFLGYQSEPKQHLAKSLFFILPSRLEGFPNALMEAMSLGKAVISTDCHDGPREILQQEGEIEAESFSTTNNGIIIRVDDVNAMSKAIQKLDSDDSLRKALGEKALNRAKDYSPESFIANYTQTIHHIIGR